MACSADINVSQGSVATYARCGGIFDVHLTANLPRNLPVNFFNLLRNHRIMVMSLWPRFFGPPCSSQKKCYFCLCQKVLLADQVLFRGLQFKSKAGVLHKNCRPTSRLTHR